VNDERFTSSEMASDPIYEGYRLCFARDEDHLFYALTLIDPITPKVGHLYRLEGTISLGLELRVIEQFKHEKRRSLATKEKVFRMPQSFRKRFDIIVRQTKRPSHPDALTQCDAGLPPYTESDWIQDIVRKTNFELLNLGTPPLDMRDS
jgi:hypothetical protein